VVAAYTPAMRVRLTSTAAALALSTVFMAPPAGAAAPADVTLVADSVSSVVSVSPDVFYDEASATFYLFTTGMRIGVHTSRDGQTWTEVSGARTPSPAFDPSVIAMPDGSYRMYYTFHSGSTPGSPCSGKQLRYATSTNLVDWTARSDVLLSDLGCGVPNVVRAGEADYRLYYVRGGEGVAHGTYMATSPDGLAWTPRAGILTPSDMVDPSVAQLADGSWLMLTADFPASKSSGPFFQKLYAATSSDGFTWDFGSAAPIYVAPTSQGAFDPDAVVLPDGSVRAWWAQGTSPENAKVAAGTVTVAPTPDPDPDPDPEPVVPASPAQPTAAWTKKSLKVTWAYPVGAPAPESFAVQVKKSGTWATVATTAGDRAAVSVARAKLPKTAFSIRVVATIGDQVAASPTARVPQRR